MTRRIFCFEIAVPALLVMITGAMLLQCPFCQANSASRVLASLGLAFSISLLVSGYFSSMPSRKGRDNVLDLIVSLGGACFAVIAALTLLTGVKPCPLCIAFWGGVLLLLLYRTGVVRAARLGACLTVVTFAGTVAAGTLPATNLMLKSVTSPFLPIASRAKLLSVGQKFPHPELAPATGAVLVVTDCMPCHRKTLLPAYAKLARQTHRLVILCGEESAPKFLADFPSLTPVDERVLIDLGVDPSGPPAVYKLNAGQVEFSGTAEDYLRGNQ